MLFNLKRLKNLIDKEGKISKYLAYAVGEIFLVVIGILIALEVNNWDKESTERKQERQYYQRMQTELLEDKRLLENEIQYNQGFIRKFAEARQIIIEESLEKKLQLAAYVTELRSISDFRRSSSIYQALVNSGEIKLVKNTQITALFQQLERDYAYIERLENVHRDAILADVITKVVDTVQMDPFTIKDEKLLFSYQYNNIFFMITDLMQEKQTAYAQATADIDKIIAILAKKTQS